jgi:16S rRNA (guanine966-N2)-methyltransferase
MFDILESRGLVEEAIILDLFSGSGALGIEALSRGAAGATFVEQDRRAIEAIEHNLEVTAYIGVPGVRVAQAEVLTWLPTYGHQRTDVVLADPPYDFDSWALLFDQLSAPTVLVEHRRVLPDTAGYSISREYRYGGTLVTLLQATPGVTSGAGTPGTPDRRDSPDPDPDPDKDTA